MAKKKESERKRRKEIDDPELKAVMRRVAANIQKLRGDETLQSLGVRAKVAATTIWEIENRQAFNVKMHTLVTIAKALGVDLIDLLK